MSEIDNQVKTKPLSYEEAKLQFETITKEQGIKHTYSFDDYWEMMQDFNKRKEFRSSISKLQEQALNSKSDNVLTGSDLHNYNPVKHKFADGLYIREIFNPKDQLIITKVHNKQHTFFLMEGEMSIITENGVERISAPYNGITEPDTKRLIYTHTDCRFTTVHATELTDIKQIESELVSMNYENDLLEKEYIKELIDTI